MSENRQPIDNATGARGAATRWKPGQSGNPAGRPKTPSFKTLIQQLPETDKEEVIQRLIIIAKKGRPSDAIRAADLLARHSADSTEVNVKTDDFTITIAPSASLVAGEEDEGDDQ